MTEIRFYHLQKQNVQQALPGLLKKALDGDFKILVHTHSKEHTNTLDKHLWVYHPDSFLPHGCGNDEHADQQPIWIDAAYDPPNNPNLMVELDTLDQEHLKNYKLVCLMFEDWDEQRKANARSTWKSLKDSGEYDLSYWQQTENGGWEKKQ